MKGAMAEVQVLIVDDNPTNSKLARVLLEAEGFVVRTADDAEIALELLQSMVPAVILMDLQLPGIDGLELTRRLRADARWNQTWIIALTAYAMNGDEHKALAAGCDAYVTKPIDTDALPRLVAERVAQRRR